MTDQNLRCLSENYGEIFKGKFVCLPRKGRFNEKNFYNSNCGLYIYKARRTIYVIGTRRGGRNIVAYTFKSLHEKGWYIYNHDKNILSGTKYVYDDTMFFQTIDESLKNNEFPEGVLIESRYSNIDGGYLKLDKFRYDSPVFYNSEDGVYLYRLENEWALAPTINDYQIYVKSSLIYNNEAPQDANWKKNGIIVKAHHFESHNVEAENNDMECIIPFKDKNFDAIPSSIGIDEYNNAPWIKATKLHYKKSEFKLFNMVEPNDVIQGSVGSCWLLCALAALAEFPSYYERHVFNTKEINQIGKYEMNFYNPKTKDWMTICVDDRIPCTKNYWFRRSEPLFSKPHENELYILLLEKAFAKLAGSYGKISGGYPVLAWLILTGCENLQIWSKDPKNLLWTKYNVLINRDDPFNFQKLLAYKTAEQLNYDDTFKFIISCDKRNFVMAASITGEIMEKQRNDGLVERHAYSLLSAYEDENFKLVCLRNPWGNEYEWIGDWSDDSNLWNIHKDLAIKLDFDKKDDGCFWMTWEDFNNIFTNVQICCKSMPTKRSKFAEYIDEEEL